MAATGNTCQMTSALKELTAPFLAMWETFPMGVMITDPQGTVVYYNPAYSRIDNLPATFVLGRNVRFLYGPDPGPSLMMACLESGKPIVNYVCVYRTVDGATVNSANWIYPLYKDKTLAGCVGFLRDLDALAEPPAVSMLQDMPAGQCGEINFTNLVSNNAEMLKAIYSAKLAAGNPSPVLLYGDTGTGKDVFARSIHGFSMHRNNPFVALKLRGHTGKPAGKPLVRHHPGGLYRRHGQTGPFRAGQRRHPVHG